MEIVGGTPVIRRLSPAESLATGGETVEVSWKGERQRERDSARE
jgi:hypothetical protein